MTRIAAVIAAVLAAGCGREEVTHVRIEKSAVENAPEPELTTPTKSGALVWTLPSGWTQSVSGGMRYATLKGPGVEISVVNLPGDAGGELANVNRWRGQLGLPPMVESEAAASRTQIAASAGKFTVYDFTSSSAKKTRMTAALANVNGVTWFFKMLGDESAVAAAQTDFHKFVESLRGEENN